VIDFARRNDDVPPARFLDLDRLAQSFGGTDVLHHILHAFVAATVEDLAELRPFMGKADPTQGSCRRRLHRIVGGLQVLGNGPLAEEGAALELRLTRSSSGLALPPFEHGIACHPKFDTPHAGLFETVDPASETLGALRRAIREFCIKITLHLDWLMRRINA
jgi:HPt (histidine-containing phosphotransfer) domain-containing protein